MSHTTQKTTVLPQVVHTPAFASIPAREAYLRSVRHPDGRLGTTPSTQTSLCCTVYSEDDHTRPQRKRTCAEENPNCDSARGSGVPGMSAPGAGGRLLSSQASAGAVGSFSNNPLSPKKTTFENTLCKCGGAPSHRAQQLLLLTEVSLACVSPCLLHAARRCGRHLP